MGGPKNPLSYLYISITVHLSCLHCLSMHVLARVFCILLYARVSLSIRFGFHLLELEDLLEIIYLSSCHLFLFSYFYSAYVLVDICIGISIVFTFRLWYFVLVWRLFIAASWTTVVILFFGTSYSDISVSVILWLVLFAPNYITIYCF